MHAGSPFSSHPRPLHRITYTGSPSQDHFSPFILVLLFTGSPSQDHLCRNTFVLHPHPRCRITSSPIKALLNRINIAVVNKTKSRNILVRCKSNAFGEGIEDKFRRIDQRAITWPAPLTCLAQIYCSVNFSQFRLWWPADSQLALLWRSLL